jgi:hypothetical protein
MGVKLGPSHKGKNTDLRVFDNRALRRIFGLERDHVAGVWRKLHDEEFHNMHSLPNIIRMMKSRRIRYEEHAVRLGR